MDDVALAFQSKSESRPTVRTSILPTARQLLLHHSTDRSMDEWRDRGTDGCPHRRSCCGSCGLVYFSLDAPPTVPRSKRAMEGEGRRLLARCCCCSLGGCSDAARHARCRRCCCCCCCCCCLPPIACGWMIDWNCGCKWFKLESRGSIDRLTKGARRPTRHDGGPHGPHEARSKRLGDPSAHQRTHAAAAAARARARLGSWLIDPNRRSEDAFHLDWRDAAAALCSSSSSSSSSSKQAI
jgi:hypothetical protein